MSINILLCSPGDRGEDCIPEFFISLDKLEKTIKDISTNNYGGLGFAEYKIYVLIPNKSFESWDVSFDYLRGKIVLNGKEIDYNEFENYITNIYEKEMKKMNTRKVVINVKHGGFGLSDKAIEMYGELKGIKFERRGKNYYSDGKCFSYYDIKRDDPVLVNVVEKLGQLSWGMFSRLEIVEIPEDVDYTIEDYDGLEHIAEKHRTWGQD